jgi:hypothetical protein
VWEDFRDVYRWRNPNWALGPHRYDVVSVFRPCARGSILVNGQPVPGENRPYDGSDPISASLAFGESWVALGEGGG